MPGLDYTWVSMHKEDSNMKLRLIPIGTESELIETSKSPWKLSPIRSPSHQGTRRDIDGEKELNSMGKHGTMKEPPCKGSK